ncbi:hypothetical protein IFO70_04525 [Phormidium tenue FACHB-886]|nr:hypothetical protein [Phormidium tenue FACHB-886]
MGKTKFGFWTRIQRRSSHRQLLRAACLFLVVGLLVLMTRSPVTAQPAIRTDDLWRQVYQLVPELPLENQYVNQETGNVSENNTLISRLIRYHLNTKGRPPLYRLDWKLTLADYLGANERISTSVYPGADVLRPNPVQGDIAAIQKLNRTQRDALVQALVTVFNQTVSQVNPVAAPSPQPQPTLAPSPAPNNTAPRREPRPGDAQLLITP